MEIRWVKRQSVLGKAARKLHTHRYSGQEKWRQTLDHLRPGREARGESGELTHIKVAKHMGELKESTAYSEKT